MSFLSPSLNCIYLVYHLVYQNGIPVLFGIPNGIPKWYSIPNGTAWYTNGIVTTPGSVEEEKYVVDDAVEDTVDENEESVDKVVEDVDVKENKQRLESMAKMVVEVEEQMWIAEKLHEDFSSSSTIVTTATTTTTININTTTTTTTTTKTITITTTATATTNTDTTTTILVVVVVVVVVVQCVLIAYSSRLPTFAIDNINPTLSQ